MQKTVEKKYKVAIVAPTPFYYHIPLYQRLSADPQIDLMVYYCSGETIAGVEVEKMYNIKEKFGSEDDLLKGYRFAFVKNYSWSPSYSTSPFGLINFGIWKEIKTKDFDLVILQSWTNLTWWFAFLVCLFSKTPVAFMTDENILSKEIKPLGKKIIKRVIIGNFIFRYASGFLTAGSANENFYRYFNVPEKKIVRMHFSWRDAYFLKKAEEETVQRQVFRKSLGIEDNDFVILYLGRISPEKNIFTLLDAYQLIKNKNKKLFFVGNGPLYLEAKRYAEKNGIPQVYFMGFQNRKNISKFYIAADVLVLPSIYEPWGMVVNEAMHCSLPVIASDKVGSAQDLIKDGYNGFIFPAKDTEKLAQCLQKLIDLPAPERKKMGGNSLKFIHEWANEINPAEQIITLIKNNGKP